MVRRISEYIRIHMTPATTGHYRGRMDDLSTTKFKLLAITLVSLLPCLLHLTVAFLCKVLYSYQSSLSRGNDMSSVPTDGITV